MKTYSFKDLTKDLNSLELVINTIDSTFPGYTKLSITDLELLLTLSSEVLFYLNNILTKSPSLNQQYIRIMSSVKSGLITKEEGNHRVNKYYTFWTDQWAIWLEYSALVEDIRADLEFSRKQKYT